MGSPFKPNFLVLSYSQGCPSSAVSMSPSIATVQHQFCWAFKVATLSQASKMARQGGMAMGWAVCGKGLGKTETILHSKIEMETGPTMPSSAVGSSCSEGGFPGQGQNAELGEKLSV